jgi:hypothetical protein
MLVCNFKFPSFLPELWFAIAKISSFLLELGFAIAIFLAK